MSSVNGRRHKASRERSLLTSRMVATLGMAVAMSAALGLGATSCGQPKETPVNQSPTTADPSPSTSGPSGEGSPTGKQSTSGAATIDLVIEVRDSPAATPAKFVVRCPDSDNSTVPDPAVACAELERSGQSLLFPTPRSGRTCQDVYSGPQTAHVTGTFHGKPVNRAFSRTNSCTTAAYAKLAALWGGGGDT